MNYLAHVFLARPTPAGVAGALLGDFVKGRAVMQYPLAVRDGIDLHRAIDRFTDAHPLVAACRTLVSAPRRRFAGVMTDVFFDHFLVRHWERFSDTPLARFTACVYEMLFAQHDSLPSRLQAMLPHMAADDWLASYGEIESVDAALRGIARRFRNSPRARVLESGIEDLLRDYARFEEKFCLFFPELLAFVRRTQDEPVAGVALRARRAVA